MKEYFGKNFASKFKPKKLDKHKATGKKCEGKRSRDVARNHRGL